MRIAIDWAKVLDKTVLVTFYRCSICGEFFGENKEKFENHYAEHEFDKACFNVYGCFDGDQFLNSFRKSYKQGCPYFSKCKDKSLSLEEKQEKLRKEKGRQTDGQGRGIGEMG